MRSMPLVLALGLATAGCSFQMTGVSLTSDSAGTRTTTSSVSVSAQEPQLLPDGSCSGAVTPVNAGSPSRAAELGMGECELVALKGQPTDVLIGESGKGQREVQVLYSNPGARELYLFTDNRLTQIVQ